MKIFMAKKFIKVFILVVCDSVSNFIKLKLRADVHFLITER